MSMARIVTVLRRSPFVALAVGALLAAIRVPQAHAAGFLLQEQSGRGLGSAFAGEGAVAMDPTTLYYNPAGMVLVPGTQFSSSGFVVYTRSNFENRGSHLSEEVGGALIRGNSGGNGGGISLLPTFFLTHRFHQLDDRISVGIGLSAPFGLETDWPRGWVGRYHSRLSRLQTINVNPSFAVRVTDWLSIGAGANAEWAKARLTNNLDMGSICQILGAEQNPPIPPAVCTSLLGLQPQKVNGYVRLKGDDWSAGYNIGLLFMPWDGTRIGLTYRSRIEHTLTGDAVFSIPQKAAILRQQSGALKNTPAHASTTFPDRASISLFQQLTPDLHFLADVTWTNWSLFDKLVFQFQNPAQPEVTEPEDWKDSMRYSMGLVYVLNQMWSFRGGFAYDESPVPNRVRLTPRIPDADRYWLAVGLGIRPTSRIRIDLSYAHIFSPQTSTRNPDPITHARLVGNFDSNADLFAFQLTYDIDWTFSDPFGTAS
jgi:long-chain fatty acid transport protein